MEKRGRQYTHFFAPGFGVLLVLSIYVMFGTIALSLSQIDLKNPSSYKLAIGAQNYKALFGDQRFWRAMLVSFKWSSTTTLISFALGVSLSLFLFGRFSPSVESFTSFILVIPAILSRVGVAQAWRLLYRPFGIFNYFLSITGLGFINFLAEPRLALFSVISVDVWQWFPLVAFLSLSILNSIPKNYVEEAMMEGATRWQICRFVLLPMTSRGLIAILLIKLVESLRTFDLIYNLTQGGPGGTTETMDLFAFYQGVTIAGKISYAASMSVIMLVVSLCMVTILWKLVGKPSSA